MPKIEVNERLFFDLLGRVRDAASLEDVETFFRTYTEKVWGRHPRNISADWGAQRVKGLSILALLKNIFGKKKGKVETSLITEFLYPKLGPGQLWECVAKDVEAMGGSIVMDARVEDIAVKEGRIASVAYEKDGAKVVVEADDLDGRRPLGDLQPALNGGKLRLADSTTLILPGAPEPVRVYVGLESAATIEARVALALDEVERLGALDRRPAQRAQSPEVVAPFPPALSFDRGGPIIT